MARARALLLIVAAVGTIGCDRVTKHAASAYLAGTPQRFPFGHDTGRLRRKYWRIPESWGRLAGGFLSLGADLPPGARNAVFTVATGTALMALLVVTLRRKYTGSVELGLVLFIAGGASNWIDRVLRGSVVDFLNMGIGPLRTGVFNMADVAIMLGAGLRTWRVALEPEKWEPSGSRSTRGRRVSQIQILGNGVGFTYPHTVRPRQADLSHVVRARRFSRSARSSRKSSIFFERKVGVVFMRVNSKCAHQVRPPLNAIPCREGGS